MRITDEGGDEGTGFRKTSNIMDSIKAKSQVKAADTTETTTGSSTKWERPTGTPAWEKGPQSDAGKVSADVQSAKLKQLLGQIKTN
jgi:hypothetical protein